MTKEITTKEIYDLVNSVRKELADQIQRLNDSFSTLEAGRLTNLERRVADMEGINKGRGIVLKDLISWGMFVIAIVALWFRKA